ncbi:hypothetical protein M569_03821, partial [Genlisea aurea]
RDGIFLIGILYKLQFKGQRNAKPFLMLCVCPLKVGHFFGKIFWGRILLVFLARSCRPYYATVSQVQGFDF